MSNIDAAEIAGALAVLPSDIEGRHRAVLDVLQWFTFDHLPNGLPRSVSAMIAGVAGEIITMIDVDDPELTRGRRRLVKVAETTWSGPRSWRSAKPRKQPANERGHHRDARRAGSP